MALTPSWKWGHLHSMSAILFSNHFSEKCYNLEQSHSRQNFFGLPHFFHSKCIHWPFAESDVLRSGRPIKFKICGRFNLFILLLSTEPVYTRTAEFSKPIFQDTSFISSCTVTMTIRITVKLRSPSLTLGRYDWIFCNLLWGTSVHKCISRA